ncbi:MAG: fimbria/pilus periplasmic chaperone [Gemmatimonadaceae bacterium]|nr:fimbria/pilus periplasmic chaperone [Gemmatimonadaceae bacterium]
MTLLVMAMLGIADAAAAQAASVSPQALLLTSQSRIGTLHVLNPYSTPIEVVIDLRYGYVTTDSAGQAIVTLPDDSVAAPNSAVPLLRVTPARFILVPGAVQLVRVAAFPPATLAEGEYWARIGIRAIPPSNTGGAEGRGIAVGVGIQVKTVLPVFYRHARVATGVRMATLAPRRLDDSLIVQPTFTRSGSAAALLAVETVITDGAGEVLARSMRQAAVYHTLSPRYALALTPAQWARATTVRVTATSQRPDLPAGLPLPVLPVSQSVAIRSP